MFFNRGNIISIDPNIKGTSHFPKPPIKIGMTKKNIIKRACAVTIALYKFLSFKTPPGTDSSKRIKLLKAVPKSPLHTPNNKYKVPISL